MRFQCHRTFQQKYQSQVTRCLPTNICQSKFVYSWRDRSLLLEAIIARKWYLVRIYWSWRIHLINIQNNFFQHYPELTSVESLAENTTTVVTKFPPTSPLIAHWLKSIAEKIKSIQLTKSATYITIILFQMVTIVNLYFLNFLLRLIEEIIHSSPKKFQLLLCKLLFKIISTNFDYTRKETCIKWYLHLVHDLGLRHEKL